MIWYDCLESPNVYIVYSSESLNMHRYVISKIAIGQKGRQVAINARKQEKEVNNRERILSHRNLLWQPTRISVDELEAPSSLICKP